MTTRIRLINAMLATTGTAALSAQDSRHPSYIKANTLLTDVLEEFSTMSLWFNTSIRTLEPNTEGKILVPSNAITCDPVDQSRKYSIRGQYMFDNTNYTYNIADAVECIVIFELSVEELPPAAYQFIRAQARYEFFLDADGSQRKLTNYQNLAELKRFDLINMNIKMQDVNFFNSAAYKSFIIRRSTGGRYSGTVGSDTRGQIGNGGY